VHCTKEYVLPIGVTPAAGDNAANQTVVFVGKTQLGQFPKLWMDPATGLDEAVTDSEALVPTDAQISSFYASRDTEDTQSEELLTRQTAAAVP
jgi:hypothetical protein